MHMVACSGAFSEGLLNAGHRARTRMWPKIRQCGLCLTVSQQDGHIQSPQNCSTLLHQVLQGMAL